MRRLLPVLGVISLAATALAGESAAERFQKVADRLLEAIKARDYAAVRRDFNTGMLDALSLEKTEAFLRGIEASLGQARTLGRPRLVPPNVALFPLQFDRGTLDMRIVLDAQDKVAGLWLQPHVPPIPVPEKHETELSLPFEGRWFVFWGGDTKELNPHHDVPNQRYAFDFLVVGEDGKSHKGEGTSNEDYYAFGKEILAPADGVVTEAIDGVRDNVPRSMNPYSALGNAVLIQHREHEVSVLAHFKLGSVKVKAGDRVRRGQVLGLCGNSGNSSEPHLHYHLQNTPIIQDGTGIKCCFGKVVVTQGGGSQVKSHYSPVRGETVSGEE